MQIDDQPFYAWERPQTPEMIAVRLMRLTIRVLMMMRRIIALRLVTMTMILIMIMVTMMVIALLLNAAAAAAAADDIYIMMQCLSVCNEKSSLS